MLTTSPFAPVSFPSLHDIAGVEHGAVACGLKQSGNRDLLLVRLPLDTAVAGVFTQSLTAAPPVDWCRSILSHGRARALVVHAGNANAFTGRPGLELVHSLASEAARLVGCSQAEVFVAATGVIGKTPPAEKLFPGLTHAHAALAPGNWDIAATTIATTDTYPKGASAIATIGGQRVAISGYAKGSGMIMPDMATLLGFVYTDAKLPPHVLQDILSETNRSTFRNITVDSDTSTNDTVLSFATGQANHPHIDSSDTELLRDFKIRFQAVMLDLALQIVRDGEGISKFITVRVSGARDSEDARTIAMSIANSPLVKTAIAGGDPNWGRVVMAVGKAGPWIDKHKLSVQFGNIVLGEDGSPKPLHDPQALDNYMRSRDIQIHVNVGVGVAEATVWTSDLTHGYISINADYHT